MLTTGPGGRTRDSVADIGSVTVNWRPPRPLSSNPRFLFSTVQCVQLIFWPSGWRRRASSLPASIFAGGRTRDFQSARKRLGVSRERREAPAWCWAKLRPSHPLHPIRAVVELRAFAAGAEACARGEIRPFGDPGPAAQSERRASTCRMMMSAARCCGRLRSGSLVATRPRRAPGSSPTSWQSTSAVHGCPTALRSHVRTAIPAVSRNCSGAFSKPAAAHYLLIPLEKSSVRAARSHTGARVVMGMTSNGGETRWRGLASVVRRYGCSGSWPRSARAGAVLAGGIAKGRRGRTAEVCSGASMTK
jgi:hypothetical protein